jgi:transcriptional regulator with XRE-family HTH domain
MTDEKNVRQEIAGRLRLAREQAGLSQASAAEKFGWHRPTISEIEAGRRRVSGEEIAQLARMYGVDANWLVSGDEGGGDPAIQLAARALSNLKKEDAEKILKLLRRLSRNGDEK